MFSNSWGKNISEMRKQTVSIDEPSLENDNNDNAIKKNVTREKRNNGKQLNMLIREKFD